MVIGLHGSLALVWSQLNDTGYSNTAAQQLQLNLHTETIIKVRYTGTYKTSNFPSVHTIIDIFQIYDSVIVDDLSS